MKKTVEEYLNQLHPHHRDFAISMLKASRSQWKVNSLQEAIDCLSCGIGYNREWCDSIINMLNDGEYFDAPQHTPEEFDAKAKEKIHGLPDTGGRSEFSTGAVRDASEGKGLPSHLPTRALFRASRRFEDGAAKYTAHNWRKGIPLSRYIDSLNRHTWLFMQGDTSEDHLGAISWNALCLSETFDLISEGKLPESLNDLPEHQQ